MQHYELTYILPMTYTVDEIPGLAKKVTTQLTDYGATIAKETSMGKLKFAYPINKLSHGYYNVVEFDMEGEKTAELETFMRLSEDVVRHMLVIKRIKSEQELANEQKVREKIAKQDQERGSIFDEVDEDETPRPKRPARAKSAPRAAEKSAPATESEKKEAIADLDKKLDAILEGDDMLK